MSTDDTFQVQPTPKKSGSNTLLIVGIGCGVMLLLCCGVTGGLFYWGYGVAQKTVVTDPAQAELVGREIAQVDLPDRYEATFAMDYTEVTGIFGADDAANSPTRGVWYVARENDDASVVKMFEMNDGSASEAEANAQIMELQASQYLPQQALIDVPSGAQIVNTETHERTIGGELAKFTITEYRDEAASETYWHVQGAFKNETGWVFFLLVDKNQSTDKAEIIRILDSIE